VTHPILSRIPHELARREIETSRLVMRQRTRNYVDVFCYPRGLPIDYTADVERAVREAGYRGCYVAYARLVDRPYELGRYGVSADMVDFDWKLCGAERRVLRLRERVGRGTTP
jgi:hypothetical protein